MSQAMALREYLTDAGHSVEAVFLGTGSPERVPDYFRVDASLSIEGNLKADKNFHSTWSLNVYNALGRSNPQSIFFEPEANYLKGFSFSVIGVPIITVAWNIKLGNYESN